MDTLNPVFYSEEAVTLFAKRPPLLIRFGYLLICLFIFMLVMSGSMLNVPYVYKVRICEIENGCFLFEDKGLILNNKPFELVTLNGDMIEVDMYNTITLGDVGYIQFSLEGNQKLLIEDSTIYDVITTVSLIKCYSTYLLHGTQSSYK